MKGYIYIYAFSNLQISAKIDNNIGEYVKTVEIFLLPRDLKVFEFDLR